MKKKAKTDKADKLDHISEALRPLAVPMSGLITDSRNARTHPKRNVEAIRASLERFGQQAPVVFVTRRISGKRMRVVIKGNGILTAARDLRWEHLAAVKSRLAEQDATAYAIADNRTTDLSEFDNELLAAQLQELEEAEYDIEAAGYTDEELQDLVEEVDEIGGGTGLQPVATERKRGERTALFVVGHLKFETPRADFDRWMSAIETKVGNDPDRVVAEIKRRLKLA